jgi:DNA helicase II / ATP-dependent DNA helicase PcrA
MRFVADLHIHSKYSRATSRDCDLEHLALWAKKKGITVVATGDFTHPAWWQELLTKLEPAEPGLFRLKPEIERQVDESLPPTCRGPVRFLLEVEISTIYKKDDATRKVHHLIYAASFETAGRFRDRLGRIGNINSDGRPILGLDSRHLLEIVLESGDDAYLIPAHVWTPWFSVLGSKSGFDRFDDCYGDLSGHIFAVETGLSSDPPMNWRVSQLDRFTLVSNSDAHSPPMLGREACVFETELDYFAMRRALETQVGWGGTLEFFPEEGKYHLDGHRACDVCLEPEETRRLKGMCPSCGRPLTVGVLNRVETLADRPVGAAPARPAPFRSLLQLPAILAEINGTGAGAKGVLEAQDLLQRRLGPELELLERADLEDVRRQGHPLLAEALARLRAGKIRAQSGYDGVYGTIRVFEPDEISAQTSLFGPDVLFPSSRRKATVARQERIETQELPEEIALAAPDAPTFLAGLDPEQAAAAAIVNGAVLIVAGPGTGKTRTLTHRLAHLIDQGLDPESCLAVTFTRRAKAEMAERLTALLGPRAQGIMVKTFHGLGLELVSAHAADLGLPAGFAVADFAQAVEILISARGLSKKGAAQWVEEAQTARREAVLADAAIPCAVADYRALLNAHGRVDLDDLLLLPIELFTRRPELLTPWHTRFRHIAVDEYQDIDAVQYRLMRLLVGSEDRLRDGSFCCIGDPDQSIYRFRGAEVGFFLRFAQDFPGAHRIELNRNYRSQATVVKAALQAIAPSSFVPERQLHAMTKLPARPLILLEADDESGEARLVAQAIEELLGGTSHFAFDSGRITEGDQRSLSFDDIAVLYRSAFQAERLLEALEGAGFPCQKRSHDRLAKRADVRLLLQALAIARDREPEARIALRSWLDRARAAALAGKSGEDATLAADLDRAVALLAPLAEASGDDLGEFLAAVGIGIEIDSWDPRAERISLLTLHASKGLEFPVVFIVGCEEGILPWRLGAENPAEVEEERRLFFVGLTRARERLLLSRARNRSRHGESRPTELSRFVRHLDPRLLERRSTKKRPPAPKIEQMRLL